MQFKLGYRPILRNTAEVAAGATPVEPGATAPALSTLLSTGATPATGAPAAEGGSQTDQRGSAPLPAPTGEGTEGSGAAEGGIASADAAPSFSAEALKLPEGVTLDQLPADLLTSFGEVLTDPALSAQERGQKLFDLYQTQATKATEAVEAAAMEQWTKLNDSWRTAVEAMPEFKGKVQQELGAMKQALTTLGAGEEFFQALDLTGAGNNPHILQILHKLTTPLREGGATSGGSAARPATRDRAATFYPTMQQKG